MEFPELLSKLKQSNVSKDAEKTKSRVKDLWRMASKPTREAVLALAGVKIVTLQRTYLNGNISARMALALAKTLNVNPYFLTGQTDEAGTFSDAAMVQLLRDHKYDKLLAEAGFGNIVKKRGRRKAVDAESVMETAAAEAAASAPVEEAGTAATSSEGAAVVVEAQSTVPAAVISDVDVELTEEEAVLLLKAAFLKAKAGGIQAEKAKRLKAMLLS